MTDMVKGKGPHAALINIISKAISTGRHFQAESRPRDNAFHAGRISGLVHAAGVLAELTYSVEYDGAQHVLVNELEHLHLNWSDADLRNEDKVENAARAIVAQVLLGGLKSSVNSSAGRLV